MGIYSSNVLRESYYVTDFASQIEPDESYNAVTGCAMAFLESQQNDLALFNATIANDFKEVAMLQEGYEVINESASGLLERIKQIFIKLLAKIKGIFKSFIAKLSATFGSNKGVYDDYVKQINKYYNWKDFKVKNFRKLKGDGTDAVGRLNKIGEYKIGRIAYVVGNIDTGNDSYKKLIAKGVSDNDSIDSEDINEYLIDNRLGSDDLKKELDNDLNNMNEAFMDCVFEDADTEDEWKTSDIINGIVGSVLKEGNKIQDNVEKCNKNLTNIINKIIDQLDKEAIEVNKQYGNHAKGGKYTTTKISADVSDYSKNKASVRKTTYQNHSSSAVTALNLPENKWIIVKTNGTYAMDGNDIKGFDTKEEAEQEINNNSIADIAKIVKAKKSVTAAAAGGKTFTADITGVGLEALSKKVSVLQRIANQEQELITKFTTARLTATKFLVSQARKVWASAAAYSSTEHKNEGYEFYTAIGEASAYDFMSDMEALD